MNDRPAPRRRFAEGTTVADLEAYMVPFVRHLGFKLNTEREFAHEVLQSEIEILDRDGDVYCPCRVRTGDPKEDIKIICPCIPFYLEQFNAMRKCWCGLFIREDVLDGAEMMGVIEEPEGPIEVRAAHVEDIAASRGLRVKIGKREIALFRTGNEVFALSNLCRHAFGPLSEGYVEGYEVMCPWHGWRYDIRTGHTDHPNADVQTHPVTVRDGVVFVTVPKPTE
ncbi:MAG: Rieske 2Fe-2S domain-containing protein [Coriobacteriales bacterium]|nr:Rieske 2Fe-2S domain-containing protein [Coriobacteriales bacterium]